MQEEKKKKNMHLNSCRFNCSWIRNPQLFMCKLPSFSFLFFLAQLFVEPRALHDGRFVRALYAFIFSDKFLMHNFFMQLNLVTRLDTFSARSYMM